MRLIKKNGGSLSKSGEDKTGTGDFCKESVLQQERYMIADKKTRHRNKPNRMSNVEMTVLLNAVR